MATVAHKAGGHEPLSLQGSASHRLWGAAVGSQRLPPHHGCQHGPTALRPGTLCRCGVAVSQCRVLVWPWDRELPMVSRSAGHTGAQLAQHHGADMGENHAGLSLGSGFWHCVTGSGEVLANPVGISSSSSSPEACPQAATPACEGLVRALAGAGDRHNLHRARL